MFFKRKKNKEEPASNNSSEPKFDVSEYVNNLIEAFKEERKTLFSAAVMDSDKEWNELVSELSDTLPFTEDERKEALQRGVQISKGVPPMEFRAALDALREKYEAVCEEADQLYREEIFKNNKTYDAFFEFSRNTLNLTGGFVDKEIAKYIKEVKKTESSFGDIFAKAGENPNKYSQNLKDEKSYTIRCKGCGAARTDTNQYGACSYCGSDLFERIEK